MAENDVYVADLYAGDILPDEAWDILQNHAGALLVDVRTEAEWAYVGVPSLATLGREPIFIPWMHFPSGDQNPHFADQVAGHVTDKETPILFLCRSGQRSRAAAQAVTALGFTRCYNIAHGFEGDKDADHHRSTINGWKVDGLPWVQG